MSARSDLGTIPRIESVTRRELLTITIAAALFAACRSDSDEKEAAPEGAAGGDFPATIGHAKGETTVPAKPERVVAVGGLDAALANALGADVVAVPTFMKDYPWYATPLRGDVQVQGYEEIDFEAIAAGEDTTGLDVLQRRAFERVEASVPSSSGDRGGSNGAP